MKNQAVYRNVTTEDLWTALESCLRRLETDDRLGQNWRARPRLLREAREIAGEIKLRGVQLSLPV